MCGKPKLFLYSLSVSLQQCAELTKLAGKDPGEIRIALIENAADPIPNSNEWLGGFRAMLTDNGYRVERVDLRNWTENSTGLWKKLGGKDVICLGGGHTYYLRWILKKTGVDHMIRDLVSDGKVYAGWSAGAIMAGPTTRYFDLMGDNPAEAPEYITDGLLLTNTVVIPHLNSPDFNDTALLVNERLREAGFITCLLTDEQVFITNESKEWVI
jgi:dipeptidase E